MPPMRVDARPACWPYLEGASATRAGNTRLVEPERPSPFRDAVGPDFAPLSLLAAPVPRVDDRGSAFSGA